MEVAGLRREEGREQTCSPRSSQDKEHLLRSEHIYHVCGTQVTSAGQCSHLSLVCLVKHYKRFFVTTYLSQWASNVNLNEPQLLEWPPSDRSMPMAVWHLVDYWLMWEGPAYWSQYHLRLMVLGTIRKQTGQAIESKSLRSVLQWPLLQFLFWLS